MPPGDGRHFFSVSRYRGELLIERHELGFQLNGQPKARCVVAGNAVALCQGNRP
jgi:hypothetical protein